MSRRVTEKEAEHLVNRGRALSERVAVYNQRVVGEGDSLAEEVSEIRKELALALKSNSQEDILVEVQRAKAIVEGHGPGGDLRKLCKQRAPALLSMMVGARTNVVTLQRNEAIRLKEEYHAFRDRLGLMLFVFSASLLIADFLRPSTEYYSLTPPYMICVQLFLCWLLYVYTALALRENVLKVNGSGIRNWWIRHHYWSIATCMLVLTLPVDSPNVQLFVKKWVWWSCWQGIMMILQNHYQRRRMYTRIALGKNRAMDVVSGESSGGTGQLVVLYPLLFGLQGFQCFIGLQMMKQTAGSFFSAEGWLELEAHESDLRGSRGIALAGALMLFMGVLNFKNTAGTIWDKRQIKKRKSQSALPVAPAGLVNSGSDPTPTSPQPRLSKPAATTSGSIAKSPDKQEGKGEPQQGAKHVHAEGRRPGSPPEGSGREKPPLGARGLGSTSPPHEGTNRT